jgi:hypothetical protein
MLLKPQRVNASLRNLRAFRNPGLLPTLVQSCGLDPHGSFLRSARLAEDSSARISQDQRRSA